MISSLNGHDFTSPFTDNDSIQQNDDDNQHKLANQNQPYTESFHRVHDDDDVYLYIRVNLTNN